MNPLKIGQTKVHPPEYVDFALKEIGYNSGRMSPLVRVAMDLDQRPAVEQMLDDGVFQLLSNDDESTKEKWFRFAETVKRILLATKRLNTQQQRLRAA